MSDPDDGTDEEGESESASDRDAVLDDLQAVRERARFKVWGDGRIRDEAKAEIRIKYMRLVIQSANAERRLLKDKEIEDLQERVDQLESESEPVSASAGDSGWDLDSALAELDS